MPAGHARRRPAAGTGRRARARAPGSQRSRGRSARFARADARLPGAEGSGCASPKPPARPHGAWSPGGRSAALWLEPGGRRALCWPPPGRGRPGPVRIPALHCPTARKGPRTRSQPLSASGRATRSCALSPPSAGPGTPGPGAAPSKGSSHLRPGGPEH